MENFELREKAKDKVIETLKELPEYDHYSDDTLTSLVYTITEEYDHELENIEEE